MTALLVLLVLLGGWEAIVRLVADGVALSSGDRVSVFLNWAWNYFTWDRGPRLILEPVAEFGADAEQSDDQLLAG